jgi:hypothetical protein
MPVKAKSLFKSRPSMRFQTGTSLVAMNKDTDGHRFCRRSNQFQQTLRSTIMWKTSLAIAVGFVLALGTVELTSSTQGAPPAPLDGWRYTDGYWNYYEPTDKAWYYTDGQNWYTYGNNAWSVYRFDKIMGTKGFVGEGYVVPGPNAKVVIPRHKVYVP